MFERKRVGFHFEEDGTLAVEKPAYSAISYTLGVKNRLNGGLIAGAPTWVIPDGTTVVKSAESNTTTSVTVRLGGGVAGERHLIKCRWQSSNGDQDETEFALVII
ncbi:hypothetical protein HPT27_10565 [Permianibacter sp. IMCC34836]|uniref:phage fiber-tail adaptor protein n=1 Tax=Permianibacter fluminis TaxID=2738515 RepID=UPI001552D40F|nr:hypothetical protein [Permianibacter fluminis]NQD37470.1 hypothetical protein [Permianibacter fluminis]